ncbi:hypothetical protein [Pseudoalteromonas sp. S554]|uniref:hypothetical protein n=1 Tax=Pseudoalteromonas sp. S554 TaxID=2066516 RepID=UPI00110CD769|nr:hypothetical protein [Pseudoalteromonas sp. S554]TMS81544.1 hypothetical protein CWB65_09680 [Pseudoalteromonas sp. S554]
MTASAGAWYRVGTVNVVGGSQSIVGVDTNWQNDVIAIAIGDIFTLDAKTWYEVTAVNSDTSITLDRGFEGSTGQDKSYAILRNTSGTILTRIAGQVSVQFNQKQLFLDELRTWLNSDNATEELTDSHGLKQSLKTPSQMVRDHDSKLAELDAIHPYPYAMRKVEFEANRAANNEKFAASGFVHFGKSFSPQTTYYVNEGLWCKADNTAYTDKMMMGWGVEGQLKGDSKTNFPEINIAGVNFKLLKISNNILSGDTSVIKFPPAEDGTRTYDSETGNSVTHSTPAIAFASETDTNKVVTERVDMWGFEAFLREIHDGDPFVYKNGLIQSQSANIDGVTTVTDNVRPDTYFAWYEGDTTSTGKGVNWQTATEAQRTAIASNPENNIYFDDETGKFYQWCVRGRSFAGAGNGDWTSLESNGSPGQGNALNFEYYSNRKLVYPIGDEDNDVAYTSRLSSSFQSLTYLDYNGNPNSGRGVFSTQDNKVHFLVCGTVNRLNQGAYHPSHNPMGAASTVSADGNGNVVGSYWHTGHSLPIPDKSQCFNNQPYGAANAVAGSYDNTGSLKSVSANKSGRPDGRFYDAIYASGQGGVCRDIRYSAWGLTPNDFAEADLRVKSGGFRGREALPFSIPVVAGESTQTTYLSFGDEKPEWWDDELLGSGATKNKNLSDMFLINQGTGETLYVAKSGYSEVSSLGWYFRLSKTQYEFDGLFHGLSPNKVLILQTKGDDSLYKTPSIAYEYTHTEVIGDPANILQCDDLKDGWVGSWNPKIPDGTGDRFPITRKVISASDDVCYYSSDLGASWLSTPSAFNLIETSNSVAHPAIFNTGSIIVYQFRSRTKLTKDSGNSKVYGGEKGLGLVFSSMNYIGNSASALNYSLTGKVPIESPAISRIGEQSQNLLSNSLRPLTGELYGANISVGETTHPPLMLSETQFNSPAFKALNYSVEKNQQGFINYAYTELKYDTDWGDDGKIHIADNQSTRIDDNGNTVLYGTARIVEPLGWIKNEK